MQNRNGDSACLVHCFILSAQNSAWHIEALHKYCKMDDEGVRIADSGGGGGGVKEDDKRYTEVQLAEIVTDWRKGEFCFSFYLIKLN